MTKFKLFERETMSWARLLVITMLATVGATEMWGTMYLEYGGNTYSPGSTLTINIDLGNDMFKSSYSRIELKNSSSGSYNGWTLYYNSCWIDFGISGTYTPSLISFEQFPPDPGTSTGWSHTGQYGTENVDIYYRFDETGDYTATLSVNQKDYNGGTTQQSGSFTIKYHVTRTTPTYTITYHLDGVEHREDSPNPIGSNGSGFDAYFNYADGYGSPLTVKQFKDGGWSCTGNDPCDIPYNDGSVYYVEASYGIAEWMFRYSDLVEDNIEIWLTATPKVCNEPTVSNGGLSITYQNSTTFRVTRGYASDKGSSNVTRYGWTTNTTGSPTISDNEKGYNSDVTVGYYFSGYADFSGTSGTTYYVRPYATNSCGTGYGGQVAVTLPYLITLNTNGGTNDGAAYIIPTGTGFISPYTSLPTRTGGWTLEGYYTASACDTKIASSSGVLQASVTVSGTPWTDENGKWVKGSAATFYANWINTFTITLNGNNATSAGSPSSVTVDYNSSSLSSAISNPSRDGYTFDGWNTQIDGTGYTVINTSGNLVASQGSYTDGSANWVYTSNVTLYAKWTPNRYRLTVDNLADVADIVATDEEGDTEVTEGNYRDVLCGNSVALTHGAVSGGKQWGGWKITNGSSVDVTADVVTEIDGDYYLEMPAYAITVSANLYTDYVFSCAELTLTGPSGDTVFITSTANKSVRSVEAFHVTGSGLTPGETVTFSFGNSDLNDRFDFVLADGTAPTVSNPGGSIDADIYVKYTPASTDVADGLNIADILTASVGGAKPKTSTALSTKTIIGRHLPADFVIAVKKDGKWWAMPSNMATTDPNPAPVEIAVDDADNPTIAYTATSNMYSLYDQSAGEYIKLAMKGQSDAPLFGQAPTNTGIGKSGTAIITNTLGDGYLWKLVQTRAEGLSNPQEAKYTIYSKNNNTNHLRLKENAGNPIWGLYDSGVEELRLIPASAMTVVEAYFIEYGTAGGVIEVDAGAISATKVKAKLNGNESNKITLSQTGTSGGKTSKYNYTVTFDGGVNFAASDALGKILMLEWYNSSDVLVGVTSIEMPKIITSASKVTMSSIETKKTEWAKWEVHVLPGTILEANLGSFSSGGAIRELHIYPGATLKITAASNARTITIDTLILRNGWSCASGSRNYDVARLYIQPYISASQKATSLVTTNAYMDWYIDFDQYYPIAVPWKVAVNSENIQHRYMSTAATFGPSGSIRLRYYDGEQRASTGQTQVGHNWRNYGDAGAAPLPSYLEPSHGYSFSARRPSGKAFSIVRMTLGIPSNDWTAAGEQGEVSGTHKDQVTVTGYGKGTAAWYAMGWNFVGNPYMSLFNDPNDNGIYGKLETQEGTSYRYATIPTNDFSEYDQVNIKAYSLKPAYGFFVQGSNPEGETMTFSNSKITPVSAAPARFRKQEEQIPEQEAYIRLSYEGGKDQMGLIIGDDYTETYETNADLAKVMGETNSLKTYMLYGEMNMAFVAINETLAKEWIPVTVRIPEDGEYTYSLMATSEVEKLEGIYLIDYANGDKVTNLIEEDYVFDAQAGTISGRFAINAIVGERKTPTGIDVTGVGEDSGPVKFIYRDNVYILYNGVIYDATGKRVKGGQQ